MSSVWPVMVGEKEWLFLPVKYARISVKYAEECFLKNEKRCPTGFVGALVKDARGPSTSYNERV